MKQVRLTLAALVVLALGSPAFGVILISDDFDTVQAGSDIDGRAATTNLLNLNPWVAPTATFLGDGAGGLSANSNGARTASIDLGANFLFENPDVYELSVTITQPTGTGLSWIAVGFAQGNDVANNLVANNGAPWVLFRLNGLVNFYAGPGVANQLTNTGGGSAAVSATRDTPHVFKLTLDTTGTNWRLDGSVDGASVDLNGTGTAGNTYTYAANPVGSRYIAMSVGQNGASDIGTVDDFTFSATVVPEPCTGMALIGGTALLAGVRRRRVVP